MKKILIIFLLAGCSGEKPKTITIGAIEMETIPGMAAEDIYRHYETQGFTTKEAITPEISAWTSHKPSGKYDLMVTTTGKNPSEIIAIDASFINYSKQDMSRPLSTFLSDAVGIPFGRSRSRIAQKWILAHSGTGGDTTIGYVSLRLLNLGDSVHALKMSIGKWR